MLPPTALRSASPSTAGPPTAHVPSNSRSKRAVVSEGQGGPRPGGFAVQLKKKRKFDDSEE